jgi:hypothetical protein
VEPGLRTDHLDHAAGEAPGGSSPHDDIARLELLSEAGVRLATALDPRQVARELLAVSLGRFAQAAGVYVLEHLIAGDVAPVTPRSPCDDSIEVRRLAVGAVGAAGIDLEAALPPGEVVVFTPHSPYTTCVITGRPQRFGRPESHAADHIGAAAADRRLPERLLQFADFVLVPLTARAEVLGFAVFARSSAAGPFSEADVEMAQGLAVRAGMCLDNARLYERERAAARALQASLLPKTAGVAPGLEIVQRYRPAGSTALVGGDWYDVIPLGDERVALVIGDAMGHGTAAAAAMVQLRASARTLAALGLPPGEVLTWMDRLAPDLGPTQFATCLYALYDPGDRSCLCSRAGHPPPLLARPGGGCDLLDMPAGLPLGLGDTRYETTRVSVPDGATLVLYTDGLVESRERDLDTGLAAMRSVLADAQPDLDAACDALMGELVTEPTADDVTLMLARTHPVARRRGDRTAEKG